MTEDINRLCFPADLVEDNTANLAPLEGLAEGSEAAQVAQRRATLEHGLALEARTAKVGMAFRLIPAGDFMMGSPEIEDKRDSDELQHRVTLTGCFYMGKYEVTQEEWERVMGNEPSQFRGAKLPVEQVSWDETQEFLKKMCEMEGVSCGTYRLPTEAEWEYACRAGTRTPFCFGDIMDSSIANFDWNSPRGRAEKKTMRMRTVDVGSFKPNAWGLHDMQGNVWEHCLDWYGMYEPEDVVDPKGPDFGVGRVCRGGGWFSDGWDCRSAFRHGGMATGRRAGVGFRVARELPS